MLEKGFLPDREFIRLEDSHHSGNKLVDYKRVLFRALRYWYIVVIVLVTCIVLAHLINRYTTKIYPVSTSIIIKESKENAEGKLLYNNPLVDPYRNFYNELYIIKSETLLKDVVKALNFGVSYYVEGNIKTTEFYQSNFPVKIEVFPKEYYPSGESFYIEFEDNQTYKIDPIKKEGTEEDKYDIKSTVGVFGDTLVVNGYDIMLKTTGNLSPYIGKRFLIFLEDPDKVAYQYSKKLNAEWAEEGASVVNLSLSGPIPEKEIDFLKELIFQYQLFDLERKNLAATRSIEFIEEQLDEISDSLKIFESQVERFKKQNIATDLEGEGLNLYEKLVKLEEQRVELKIKRNYYNYVLEYLEKDNDLNTIVPPSSVGIEDPIVTQLIANLVKEQSELQAFMGQAKKASSLFTQKQERIHDIKRDVQTSVENILDAQSINERFLNSQITQVEQKLVALPEKERTLVNIKRNYALSESLYIFLMQKRAEAGISKASNASDILEVNPPRLSGQILTPKVKQNYAIAIIIGLAIPFLLFLTMEVLDDKIQSKEDIEKLTRIPIIGGIGHKKMDNNLIVSLKPKSIVSEAFRSLRSNLNFFVGGEDKKVFMVTSSISGEGKTFTTINLATVFALTGKKVLILGADLRKPRIYNDFNLTNSFGLSNFLSGSAIIEDVVQ
ncbi:GumC family protein, partial [Fulvivirga kasyanovii]